MLTVLAVSVAKTLRIHEVASRLPILVKNEKSKQKRLLRFLETAFPIGTAQQAWLRFVLGHLWKPKPDGHPLILIDETDLHNDWKAIVAAVAFRKRAIPIFYQLDKNTEIQDMTDKSHNEIIQKFCPRVHEQVCEVYAQRRVKPVRVFDRGFAHTKYVIAFLKRKAIAFVMRVPRNVRPMGSHPEHRKAENIFGHQCHQARANRSVALRETHRWGYRGSLS